MFYLFGVCTNCSVFSNAKNQSTRFPGSEALDLPTFEAGGAKRLLLTHRPFERPLEEPFELAHDGLEIEL